MENEKLKLLLNKVVEYNNPKDNKGKGKHFKAFLYKNRMGEYYFKVVEVLIDFSINFDDIIYLNEGDEKFLIVAAKPKLMRVSKNSWHYRLIKYILKDSAPTPKDMQNGCPYFWLLIFSVIVLPFVLIFKAIKWVILLIPKLLFFILEQLVNSWIASLDDEAAYELQQNGQYGKTKLPMTAKLFINNHDSMSGYDLFDLYLSKKYKKLSKTDPAYAEKRKEISEKWNAWQEAQSEKRRIQRELDDERDNEIRRRREEHAKKRREAEAKWEAKMKPIKAGFAEIGKWFRKTFTVERGRVNMIVKRTKQFMGAIITLVVLAFTFFAVNYISLGLMVFADLCIANWYVFVAIALLAIAAGIIYLFYILISSWGQNVVNKYKRGKRVWYIEPVIYLIWYPVKYLVLGIVFLIVYIIWTPIKFIIYTLLFKYFLKPIGLFIAKLVVGLIKGIGSSSGIFGEYFGASYSDYCPGIEWTDFDED